MIEPNIIAIIMTSCHKNDELRNARFENSIPTQELTELLSSSGELRTIQPDAYRAAHLAARTGGDFVSNLLLLFTERYEIRQGNSVGQSVGSIWIDALLQRCEFK